MAHSGQINDQPIDGYLAAVVIVSCVRLSRLKFYDSFSVPNSKVETVSLRFEGSMVLMVLRLIALIVA